MSYNAVSDIKIERECENEDRDAECDETEAGFSLTSHCSDEGVRVKQEPADLAAACDPVEELYAGHEVKEEMVIGPVVLQPPYLCASLVDRDHSKTRSDCKSEKLLAIQKGSHKEGKPFTCDVCNKSFSIKANMSRHKELHSDTTYKCNVCDRSFKHKHYLTNHKLTHLPVTFAINLDSLLAIHKGSLKEGNLFTDGKKLRKYGCDKCKKSFSTHSDLNAHVSKHKVTHKCEVCEETFKNTHRLKTHKASCGRRDKSEKHLAKDSYNSLKEGNPFTCDICNKSFAYKTNMYRHRKLHWDTTYKCKVCDRSFKQKYYLTDHMLTHLPVSLLL